MKTTIYSAVLLLVLQSLISGCGKDGVDGTTTLAISNDGNCMSSYTDNNPTIPYGMTYNTRYGPCTAGTYNYTYYFCNGNGWMGTYTVDVIEGTDGGFLHNGIDGVDLDATFHLTVNGGDMSRRGESVANTAVQTEDSYCKHYTFGHYNITVTGQRIVSNGTITKCKNQ